MARHITQEVHPLWRRRRPKLISQKNGTLKTFSSNFRPINITENKFMQCNSPAVITNIERGGLVSKDPNAAKCGLHKVVRSSDPFG